MECVTSYLDVTKLYEVLPFGNLVVSVQLIQSHERLCLEKGLLMYAWDRHVGAVGSKIVLLEKT